MLSLHDIIGCNYDTHDVRLQEICENPQFIVNGVGRFDMDQGALGELYLLDYIILRWTLIQRTEGVTVLASQNIIRKCVLI